MISRLSVDVKESQNLKEVWKTVSSACTTVLMRMLEWWEQISFARPSAAFRVLNDPFIGYRLSVIGYRLSPTIA